MPIKIEEWYTEALIKSHPDWIFVFGDNVRRKGFGGQARACRGHQNTLGVVTKWEPSFAPYAFFNDRDYEEIVILIDNDLHGIEQLLDDDRTVVFPKDGIGTGMSQLPKRAPRVWKYLCDRLMEIQCK